MAEKSLSDQWPLPLNSAIPSRRSCRRAIAAASARSTCALYSASTRGLRKSLIRPAASSEDRPEFHFSDLTSAKVVPRLKSTVVLGVSASRVGRGRDAPEATNRGP